MQRVQRKFGTFLKRSEDEADIGVILHEFEDTEKFLGSFIAHTEVFREAWRNILRTQLAVAETYHLLYQPIGTDENVRHITAATPEGPLVQVSRLESAYAQVNMDLAEEVVSIDNRLLKPALQSRDDLKPLKKVIKKRDDRKLDYERYHSRVEAARRKETRSEKDEAALAKCESDLAAATHEYNLADEHIKRALPPFLDAISRLLPHLLAAQVLIQHSLVAQLYTSVYEYCQQTGMPIPAPELEDVVSTWDSQFTPLRDEVESGINIIANGKAIHQPMEFQDRKQGSVTGLGLRNTFAEKRKGSQGTLTKPSMPSFFSRKENAQVEEEAPPTRPPRPSMGSASTSYMEEEEAAPEKPPRPGSSSMRLPSHSRLTPANTSPGMSHLSPQGSSHTPSKISSGSDYFSRERQASAASSASSAAAKKKPPPPVPAKRIPSSQGQFVTALYDFTGQNDGDLSFIEGDRIRVVKKTESTNDWWKGEIRGVTGSFPANYVQ